MHIRTRTAASTQPGALCALIMLPAGFSKLSAAQKCSFGAHSRTLRTSSDRHKFGREVGSHEVRVGEVGTGEVPAVGLQPVPDELLDRRRMCEQPDLT